MNDATTSTPAIQPEPSIAGRSDPEFARRQAASDMCEAVLDIMRPTVLALRGCQEISGPDYFDETWRAVRVAGKAAADSLPAVEKLGDLGPGAADCARGALDVFVVSALALHALVETTPDTRGVPDAWALDAIRDVVEYHFGLVLAEVEGEFAADVARRDRKEAAAGLAGSH
jgi:hypothetical protein